MRNMLFILVLALGLAGCTTLHQGGGGPLARSESWAVLPFVNNTETPYAAERAEAVTTALLLAKGFGRVDQYQPAGKEDEPVLDRGVKRHAEALAWARLHNVRYVVNGVVNEWRYKVGLDGEPVAGLTLQVVDLPSGKVVWSATAGKSGWSRDAVSAVAQQVIASMIDAMPVQ